MPPRFGPLLDDTGTSFRLWAPGQPEIVLHLDGQAPLRLARRADGFWSRRVTGVGAGARYRFEAGGRLFPDPASRQQATDADGWSVVRAPLPPRTGRPPRPWHECVICEVHVGAATPEGTFAALADRLGHFRDAGYTCIEIMPVNEFPGARNWGYDGTLVYAPEASYGPPAALRALVDRAHALDLSMILDVVYNHFGAVDGYIAHYAPEWFDDSEETPWGPAIDFQRAPVRAFYYENAQMWLDEFDFDGLRFDAVHEIRTKARDVFLGELAQAARAVKPEARLIIENVENAFHWLERDADNVPMTYWAQWNDDMHHVLTYLATGEGRKTGYDDPDKDPIADLEKALADGFVHDGAEGPESDGRTRGGPASRLPPDSFITFIENHDQLGNRSDGRRLASRVRPDQLDFLHFVKFIAPHIPLCFMGDEANLESGFPFFVDLDEAHGNAADARRYDEMRGIFNEEVAAGALPHPNDPATFARAKLRWDVLDRGPHRAALERFRALAALRRELVWPLTATPCLDARSARQGIGLIVNWIFEAGTLSLALNPSEAPIDITCAIQDRPAATGTFDQTGEVLRLGAWSAVAWRVRR
jgi:malto-oligosyltrehalose trehalohydrolase